MTTQSQTPREQLDYAVTVAKRMLPYWWLALLIAVLGTAAAVGLAMRKGRSYQSDTVIMYRDVIPDDLLSPRSTSNSTVFMQARFREMLMAQPLLQRVIEEKQLLSGVVNERGMAVAVESLRQQIVFRSRGGGTFNISYLGSTPKEAQEVTAFLAKLLIEWELRFNLETVSVAKDFLDKERLRLEEQLRKDETALAQFVAAHPEFAEETLLATGAAGASIRARNTERASSGQPATASSPRTASPARARWHALERQRTRIANRLKSNNTDAPPKPRRVRPPPPTPAQRQANALVATRRRELDQAKRRLADLKVKLTELHPDVVSAGRRVSTAQSALTQAIDAADALKPDPEPAPVTVAAAPLSASERAALVQELRAVDRAITAEKARLAKGGTPVKDNETAGDITDVVALETTWTGLVREARATRDRYQSIRSKAFTAEIMASSELARQGIQLTVVNPAQLPTHPAGAGRTLIVMAGFLFSCMMGLGVVLGVVLLDDRIFSQRDIEGLGIASVLTVIPSTKKKKKKRGT